MGARRTDRARRRRGGVRGTSRRRCRESASTLTRCLIHHRSRWTASAFQPRGLPTRSAVAAATVAAAAGDVAHRRSRFRASWLRSARLIFSCRCGRSSAPSGRWCTVTCLVRSCPTSGTRTVSPSPLRSVLLLVDLDRSDRSDRPARSPLLVRETKRPSAARLVAIHFSPFAAGCGTSTVHRFLVSTFEVARYPPVIWGGTAAHGRLRLMRPRCRGSDGDAGSGGGDGDAAAVNSKLPWLGCCRAGAAALALLSSSSFSVQA
jgi:hypothetical protein